MQPAIEPSTDAATGEPTSTWAGPLRIAAACAALVACGWAVSIAYTTCRAVVHLHTSIPQVIDHWILMFEVEAIDAGRWQPSVLFAQHNEHRMAIPRLFLYADALLFDATCVFLTSMIVAMGVLQVVLLARTFRSGDEPGWPATLFLVACAIVTFFGAVQWPNLVWPFQIQTALVALFVTSALMLALPPRGERGAGRAFARTALCVAMCAGATWSMANGVLVWPLVLGLLLVRRERLGSVPFVAACAVVAVGSYLYGYRSPPWHSDPLEALRQPLALVEYLATYMGGPIRREGDDVVRVFGAFGTIVFLAQCVGLLAFLRTRGRLPRAASFFAALGLFVLATGVITALGRLRFGIEQALEPRYGVWVLLFWLSCGALGASLSRGARGPRLWVGRSAIVMAGVFFALAGRGQSTGLREHRERAEVVFRSEAAAIAGVHDRTAFRPNVDAPETTARLLAWMERKGYSVFARPSVIAAPERSWIESHAQYGAAVGSTEPASETGPIGHLDILRPVEGDPRFGYAEGWAWNVTRQHPVDGVLLVDERDRIVGFGGGRFWRRDVRRDRDDVSERRTGWVGYFTVADLPAPFAPGAIRAIAVDGEARTELPPSGPLGR